MRNQALREDAPLKTKIDAESSYAGQSAEGGLDGVLKPLLNISEVAP